MLINTLRLGVLTCRARIISNGTSAQLIQKRNHFSNSSAYDGDGKTTVTVLNNDENRLNLINSYSAAGFRLSNKVFVAGSILVFPTSIFSWTVTRGKDINLESLLLFDLIIPKVKLLIIGYGQQGEEYDPSIVVQLKKKGISCELLQTPNAVSTYNYMVMDGVHVAGAFIPVKDHVLMNESDISQIKGTDPFIKDKLPANREDTYTDVNYVREAIKKVNRNKDQKSFDD